MIDEVAALDGRAAEHDVTRREPVDAHDRRLEPQRLLDRVGDQRPISADRVQRSPIGQQVRQRIGRHALAGLDATEQHDAGVRHDLVDCQRRGGRAEHSVAGADGGTHTGREVLDRRGSACIVQRTSGRLGDGGDDLVVPPEQCVPGRRRSGPAPGPSLARPVGRPVGGAVRRDLPAAARRPSSAATAWTSAVKRRRTSASLNASANGSRWRACSVPSSDSMLGPNT